MVKGKTISQCKKNIKVFHLSHGRIMFSSKMLSNYQHVVFFVFLSTFY